MIGQAKCQKCVHFLTPDKHASEWACEAYPDGIPEKKICYIDRDPCVNCNNGIGFEPIENNTQPAQQ